MTNGKLPFQGDSRSEREMHAILLFINNLFLANYGRLCSVFVQNHFSYCLNLCLHRNWHIQDITNQYFRYS